jgi:hypothetical protein
MKTVVEQEFTSCKASRHSSRWLREGVGSVKAGAGVASAATIPGVRAQGKSFPTGGSRIPALILERDHGKLQGVKFLLAVAAFLMLGAAALPAQEEAVLEPIVVSDTFELRPGPLVIDLFTLHLLKQMEAKRTLEETLARAPWLNAPFWKYLPALQSSSTDSSHFFTPSYLTSDYRNTARALDESRKQSIFDSR